jgi:predicted RNase H-like HicB family nuclease
MKKKIEHYINLPYKTEIYFEKDDNSWVAYHPELGKASCYAIGSSKLEALTLLDDERKSFIGLLLSENKEIPLPKLEEEELPSGQFVVRIPRSLHKKIKDVSETEKISINQFVLYAISEKIGEIEGIHFQNVLALDQHSFNTKLIDFSEKNMWTTWESFYTVANKLNTVNWGTHKLDFDENDKIYFSKKGQGHVTNS